MTIIWRLIKKSIYLCTFLLLLVSCKSKSVIADGTVNQNLSAKAIIKTHYQNQLNFKTLSGKVKIDYSDGYASQGVSVSLRMEKDKAIWMSAPLGMVKAYITPERVTFYNKLQNEYFDGDFSYLSDMLGVELNFDKVQNLLLGQALFDLRKEKYISSVSNKKYQLKPKKALDLFKVMYQIEPQNFKMATQQLSQPSKNRLLQIDYKNYQKINKWIIPNQVLIKAEQATNKSTIDLEYRNVEFNKSLNFPYKIPKGFKEIVLRKNEI